MDKITTEEQALAAVQNEGWALKYVPEELMTAELCHAAVQNYGSALKYVPEELKTAELCLMAVQYDGLMLGFVPKALKTADLCLTAIRSLIDKINDEAYLIYLNDLGGFSEIIKGLEKASKIKKAPDKPFTLEKLFCIFIECLEDILPFGDDFDVEEFLSYFPEEYRPMAKEKLDALVIKSSQTRPCNS